MQLSHFSKHYLKDLIYRFQCFLTPSKNALYSGPCSFCFNILCIKILRNFLSNIFIHPVGTNIINSEFSKILYNDLFSIITQDLNIQHYMYSNHPVIKHYQICCTIEIFAHWSNKVSQTKNFELLLKMKNKLSNMWSDTEKGA